MPNNRGPGRKPGYKHSKETKDKISASLAGKTKTKRHRDGISLSLQNLENRCRKRLEELRVNYPTEQSFFDLNASRILLSLQDTRTEKELRDIRRNFEVEQLRNDEPYRYSSSSCHAAEDVMIALLDFKRFLQKYH